MDKQVMIGSDNWNFCYGKLADQKSFDARKRIIGIKGFSKVESFFFFFQNCCNPKLVHLPVPSALFKIITSLTPFCVKGSKTCLPLYLPALHIHWKDFFPVSINNCFSVQIWSYTNFNCCSFNWAMIINHFGSCLFGYAVHS